MEGTQKPHGDWATSYVFSLLCCYKEQCPHLRCQSGQPSDPPTWYPGGPPLSNITLPVSDQERPWGGTSCTTCRGFCAGHYITQLVDVTEPEALEQILMPPSFVVLLMRVIFRV